VSDLDEMARALFSLRRLRRRCDHLATLADATRLVALCACLAGLWAWRLGGSEPGRFLATLGCVGLILSVVVGGRVRARATQADDELTALGEKYRHVLKGRHLETRHRR
jgi:hypothetical protein